MGSKFWPKGGLPGILHHYTETLVTFEYTTPSIPKPHSFLFIGGLGDGLATTSYMVDVARALEPTPWSLFTLNLSSSYGQWGLGHLDRDTDEIGECIRYISAYKAEKYANSKVVLMGHSTGSQVVLHYLHRPNPHITTPIFDPYLEHVQRPVIDGAIMQAPVSDRQAIHWVLKEGIGEKTGKEMQVVHDEMMALAKDALKGDQSVDKLVPYHLSSQIYPGNAPVSFRRLLSLISPDSPQRPGEDDLFSSDLSDAHLATTFGKIASQKLLRGKLMVLFSGADQSVPDWIDKKELLRRWKNAADRDGEVSVWDDELSAIIPGASHALSNDDQAEPRKFLCERVIRYVRRVENS